jgi:hypothetical protein
MSKNELKTCKYKLSTECVGTADISKFRPQRLMCLNCTLMRHKIFYRQNQKKYQDKARINDRLKARKKQVDDILAALDVK